MKRAAPRKYHMLFSATKALKQFFRHLERLGAQLTHVSLSLERNYAMLVLPSAARNFHVNVKVGYARPREADGAADDLAPALDFTLDAASTLQDFQFLSDALPFELAYFPAEDALYLRQAEQLDEEEEALSVLLRQVLPPGGEGAAQDRQSQRAADFFERGVAESEVICELRPPTQAALAVVFDCVLHAKSPTALVAVEQERVSLTVSQLPARGCTQRVELADSEWLALRPDLAPAAFSHAAGSFEIVRQLMRKSSSAEHMPRLCFTRQGLMLLASEFTRDLFRFEVIFTAVECF